MSYLNIYIKAIYFLLYVFDLHLLQQLLLQFKQLFFFFVFLRKKNNIFIIISDNNNIIIIVDMLFIAKKIISITPNDFFGVLQLELLPI